MFSERTRRAAAIGGALLLASCSGGEEAGDVAEAPTLAELEGTEWRLTHFAEGEPAPAEPAVTLRFEEGRVGGSGGCNRYFGTPTAGETPGSLTFGPIGATRMACPEPAMSIETRFLSALETTTRIGLADGRLELGYARGDASATLVFERTTGAEEEPAS